MKIKVLFGFLLIVALSSLVVALDTVRQDRLEFGYVLNVKNVSTSPATFSPGEGGVLKIILENKASFPLYDIRVQLNLPSTIALLEDISKRKIPEMKSGEVRELNYNIVTVPTASEGVYSASYSLDYLNHVATEREENDSFGIIIKASPKIFAEIDKADIYQGKETGDLSINFINNDVANIKFLTVELMENQDYEIISSSKQYVGDLNSDDFQSVDYKLKVKQGIKEINLPIKVYYKDSFNSDYTNSFDLKFSVKTPEELGIKYNYTTYYILGIIIALIIIYIIYRIVKNKKRNNKK